MWGRDASLSPIFRFWLFSTGWAEKAAEKWHLIWRRSPAGIFTVKTRENSEKIRVISGRSLCGDEPCRLRIQQGEQDSEHGDDGGSSCFWQGRGFLAAIWETAGSIRQGTDSFARFQAIMVLGGMMFGKAPLIQFVGIPEESMKLEPSIVREESAAGIRYLICSDGITDMLADGEIADILAREVPVEETVGILLDRALKKGGRDNATLILCEIKEKEGNCLRRYLKNCTGNTGVMRHE